VLKAGVDREAALVVAAPAAVADSAADRVAAALVVAADTAADRVAAALAEVADSAADRVVAALVAVADSAADRVVAALVAMADTAADRAVMGDPAVGTADRANKVVQGENPAAPEAVVLTPAPAAPAVLEVVRAEAMVVRAAAMVAEDILQVATVTARSHTKQLRTAATTPTVPARLPAQEITVLAIAPLASVDSLVR
jgi:hypothetical protein